MSAPLPARDIALAETVTTQDAWLQQHPTWTYRGLRDGGLRDAFDGRSYAIGLHSFGSLPLPDGRLIACDPYLNDGTPPFAQDLPPGEHPVVAAIATIEEGHIRPAAGPVVAGGGPITRWELGRAFEEPIEDLSFGAICGYGVDAGTGSFFSPSAADTLVAVMDDDGGALEDPVSAMLDSPVECGVVAPRAGAMPVAVFHSGWGDGVYATWFGYAADGTVVVALTDFDLFRDPWLPVDEPPEPPAPARHGLFARFLGR